ncbi:unannotated protein [freshwater metagenome]|uniref:Unannotated protein n=1 Tax=freshwater metagenome TaxID=449393 RepID=A0A6J7HXV2_9ZZZZ
MGAGRSARRQPSVAGADGSCPQEAVLRVDGCDGLQGNRSRVSIGIADRFRFRAAAGTHRSGTRRRHRGRLHPGSTRPDRANRGVDPRNHQRRRDPHVHRHGSYVARGRARPGGQRASLTDTFGRSRRSRPCRRPAQRAIRVLTRGLQSHRTRLRPRCLRCGDDSVGRDAAAAGHPEFACHSGGRDAECLCGPDRVHERQPCATRQRDPVGASTQRPRDGHCLRRAGCPGRSAAGGGPRIR